MKKIFFCMVVCLLLCACTGEDGTAKDAASAIGTPDAAPTVNERTISPRPTEKPLPHRANELWRIQ